MIFISRFRVFFCLLISLLLKNEHTAAIVADFKADATGGCAPFVVSFTDLTTGNPLSWQWDLGNGNSSIKRNPSAIYTKPGLYTISLIVSDGITADTVIKPYFISSYAPPA